MGFLEVALSGLFFGTLPLMGKWIYAAGVSAGELLALRFLGASFLMLLTLFLWKGKRVMLPWKSLAVCAFLGICGYALFSFLFFMSLETLSASVTVLLLYQYPWIVALGGALLLKEPVPKKQWPLFALMIVGLTLVIGFDYEIRSYEGLFYGFAAALFYSIYILVARNWLKGIDPYVAVAWIQFFAGLILGALHLDSSERLMEILVNAGDLILFTILVPTILAMGLFIAGLQKLRAWEVSVLSTLEPLTGMLLSMIYLGESFSGFQWLGGLLLLVCLVGIGITQRKNSVTAE